MMLLLLLLPACGFAVTEGVVEAAPSVEVEIGGVTDELFGAWEQGLSDIRTAAAQAAMAWKPGIDELSLERIALFNSPMDTDTENDELSVSFRYVTQERRNARLTIRYVRGTGEVVSISDTLDDGGEFYPGEAMTEQQLREIALAELAKYTGVQGAALCEGDDGENIYRWLARFASQAGVYEVCLDRQTGEAIRVSLYIRKEDIQ